MNRFKQLRIAKGLDSQRELADVIAKQYGIPMGFATISRLESGENDNPKYKTIAALAQFFNVSVEYLMGDSDDPHGDGRRPKNELVQQQAKDELPPEAQLAIEAFYEKMKSLYADKNN